MATRAVVCVRVRRTRAVAQDPAPARAWRKRAGVRWRPYDEQFLIFEI